MGIFTLALVAFAFYYLFMDLAQTIIEGIMQQVTSGSLTGGEQILQNARDSQLGNFRILLIITTLVTMTIGILMTKVALSPARNALAFQKRFIGDIAHELRTPLSIIKTNSEVALFDKHLEPNIQRMLRANIDELDRASGIINNLLTFSNWSSPKQMEFRSIDLGVIVDSSLRSLRELIKGKQLTVTFRKKSPRTIYGNSTAIGQMALNILKNSISYTPAGGKVDIVVEPDYEGNIVFMVADNGIGIERKDLPHIFEPFFRAERSRSRQYGSSGLGLAIVSELLKMHRGKILVRSAPNQGTTIRIAIPYYNNDSAHENEKARAKTPLPTTVTGPA